MLKKALRAFIAFLIVLPVMATEPETELSAKIKRACDALEENFAAATLLRVDSAALEREIEAAKPAAEIDEAWSGFQEKARRYDVLLTALPAAEPAALCAQVKEVAAGLGFTQTRTDAAVEKYLRIHAAMAKGGFGSRPATGDVSKIAISGFPLPFDGVRPTAQADLSASPAVSISGGNGRVAGYDVGYGLDGSPDRKALLDAGVIRKSEFQQFQLRLAALAGKDFRSPPRLIPGGADGQPSLIYQRSSGRATTTYISGFSGGRLNWVDSTVTEWPDGRKHEKVEISQNDPKTGRPARIERYETAYVTRYSVDQGFHVAEEASYTRLEWDGKQMKVVASKRPPDDGVLTYALRKAGYLFEKVHGFKEAGRAVAVVAGAGKTIGYAMTGGTSRLVGALTGSEEHFVYGVISKYQAINYFSGAGAAAVDELRERLGPEKFERRKGEWLERYRREEIAKASPTQAAALRNRKLDLSDEELGRRLVDGSLREGFAGAPNRFVDAAVNSETTRGKVANGLGAAVVYAADYTFRSFGFGALGGASGLLAKSVEATRLAVAADVGGHAASGFLLSMAGQQGLAGMDALAKKDERGMIDAGAQLLGLGLVPAGRAREPGAAGINFKSIAVDMVTTSKAARAMTALAAYLADPKPPAEDIGFTAEEWNNLHPKPEGADIYHSAEHSLEVGRVMERLAKDRFPGREKFLGDVARLHDVDPTRAPGTPARVPATLEWMDANNAALKARFGWTDVQFQTAKTIIMRTEFPFDAKPRAQHYNGSSPAETYKKMVGGLPSEQRAFTMSAGAMLSEYADKSSYYMNDFKSAQAAVRGLANEMSNVGIKLGADGLKTHDFLKTIGRPESFAIDGQIARELKVEGVRVPLREEAFKSLSPEQGKNFKNNQSEFGKLQDHRADKTAAAVAAQK